MSNEQSVTGNNYLKLAVKNCAQTSRYKMVIRKTGHSNRLLKWSNKWLLEIGVITGHYKLVQ